MLQRPVVELLLQSSDSDLGYQNRVSSVLGRRFHPNVPSNGVEM